jgi:hypothetical protein
MKTATALRLVSSFFGTIGMMIVMYTGYAWGAGILSAGVACGIAIAGHTIFSGLDVMLYSHVKQYDKKAAQ